MKHESDFVNGLSAFEIGASIKACSRVKRTIRDLQQCTHKIVGYSGCGWSPMVRGENGGHDDD